MKDPVKEKQETTGEMDQGELAEKGGQLKQAELAEKGGYVKKWEQRTKGCFSWILMIYPVSIRRKVWHRSGSD